MRMNKSRFDKITKLRNITKHMSIVWSKQKIPSSAGVYFFKTRKDLMLYIGKAANLKKRLAFYQKTADSRIIKMLERAAKLDWQETNSEIEALILESQLIKKHRPTFNIMLRDDKQYFFVGITRSTSSGQAKEEFPRIFLTHQPLSPKTYDLEPSSFIGPFTEGASLKSTLKILRRIFPFCTCQQKHHRYCLNYHIGNCLGFCCLKNAEFTTEQKSNYLKNIRAIKNILNGKKTSVFKDLEKEMKKSAEKHEFEKAIKLRQKLDQLQRVFENAKVIKELAGRSKVLEEFQKAFKLSSIPQRIEGYDVSNIQGQFATGSMVVFNHGHPDKNEYRKFKIRTVPSDQGGDVAMLKEILTRRFKHPEWPFPDLIIIDGGQAQLNAALITMGAFASDAKAPMVMALTKDGHHRGSHIFLKNKKGSIALQDLSTPVKNLILQIDSEAHRFAISYYRQLHQKKLWLN